MTNKVSIVWSKRALFFDFPVSVLTGFFDEGPVTKRDKLFVTMTNVTNHAVTIFGHDISLTCHDNVMTMS